MPRVSLASVDDGLFCSEPIGMVLQPEPSLKKMVLLRCPLIDRPARRFTTM